METALRSHVGCIRRLNEDHGACIHYDTGWVLAIVADGMGGHQAGDVASRMAVQVVKRELASIDNGVTGQEACRLLEQAILTANREVYQYSLENDECHGMGTTIVTALASPDWVAIAHIGDSRIYKKTEDQLVLLTEDHSLVNELQRKGQITEEEAHHHPQKNVLIRALGTEQEVVVDTRMVDWKPGETLLLCSDGLTNMVVHDELNQILTTFEQVDDQANEMVQKALKAGGDDNVTVIIVHHPDSSCHGGGEEQ
ncbi:MAG: Stp1/IreP family PP2C-type Ser/Thr phosphatase [Bacillaceae bacterium]|nr:Stp1/IreP family PP2C-type Ser/Thr phosphatase [Bacillaceae bacterium]